ncbi:hypothetical protein HJG60_010989 [Phyllostomus discolor]|uniref:Uncharacterized protein n=1 Tax=Phyllostomus discolor TaxID=89673 RepID=A0A834AHH1_9CHIR|nr:hypothetical protein HJG60_010989 [Phyllostomus discolor]
MALGLEGRLGPGLLDCKGGPWWEGQEAASVSHSPWVPSWSPERHAPWATLTRGRQQPPRLQEAKRERGHPEIRRTKGCSVGLGWAPAQGSGVGAGWVRPGPPLPFRPPQSTSVLARKPIAYLSCRPRLWAGGWGGSGSGPRTPSVISSRWGTSQGGVICLPCHGGGTPSPGPRPLGREGILRKEGPQEQPCPQPPQTHPNLKAMRVRVYRNYVQSPEKPPPSPGKKKKKKTRQKLIYIFCIWSSVLNINCVIFIHFLSLNSPLIYQFNVSWGFFSHGVLCPHPHPFV